MVQALFKLIKAKFKKSQSHSFKQCLNENFKIHLISQKLRSRTAPYHIFSFNCLRLLISPMPDVYVDQMSFGQVFLTKRRVTSISAIALNWNPIRIRFNPISELPKLAK
jgi:hypothetical protein